MVKTDAQIEAEMQDLINDTWPPAAREKALRKGGALLDELNEFFVSMSAVKIEKMAARDLEQAVADYEAALLRYDTPFPDVPPTVKDDLGHDVINPAILEDDAERTAAKAIIDGASQAVLDMYAIRHPMEVVNAV